MQSSVRPSTVAIRKIAHLVNGLTDGQQFLTLLVTAGVTVILGLGMPTPAAYILAASLMRTEAGEDLISTNSFFFPVPVLKRQRSLSLSGMLPAATP